MDEDTPLHVRMHAEPIVVNFSAPSFHRWAAHYYACRQTFVSPDPGFSPVPYVLLCRAIELELKSRHLEQKRYHAQPAAQQTLAPAELAVLEQASRIYASKDKEFDYIKPGDAATAYKRFPDLVVLDAVAKKLIGEPPKES